MEPTSSAAPPSSPAAPPFIPPRAPRSGGGGLATVLAAVALAIALVALAVSLVVPGPVGPAGASTSSGNGVYWASVDPNGSLVRGFGAIAATPMSTENTYGVIFSENVSHCGLAATVANPNYTGQPSPSLVSVAPVPKDSDAVLVEVWSLPGAIVNRSPFMLGAFCSGYDWAAVAASGSLNASAGVSSATIGATGNYTVKFSSNVANCAFLATIGSTAVGAPPSGSAAVAAISGESNEASVTTYNASGAPHDEPFYLTAVCHGAYEVVSSTGARVVGTGNGTEVYGTGVYQVNFTTIVRDCAYFATLGHPESSTTAAVSFIGLTGRDASPYALWVNEDSPAGTDAAAAFQTAAVC